MLANAVEADVRVRAGDAQVPQPPDVAGVLDVPAGPVVQFSVSWRA